MNLTQLMLAIGALCSFEPIYAKELQPVFSDTSPPPPANSISHSSTESFIAPLSEQPQTGYVAWQLTDNVQLKQQHRLGQEGASNGQTQLGVQMAC